MSTLPSLNFVFALLLWTFISYWMHRLAHIHHPRNPFWRIHRYHHRVIYKGERMWPEWYNFFFWFGTWQKTLDVWFIYTIPAILAAVLLGGHAFWILPVHYIYEIFLSDEIIEHNPKIKGKINRIFAVGEYHMRHHHKFMGNYAFMFTLWDKLFKTEVIEKSIN